NATFEGGHVLILLLAGSELIDLTGMRLDVVDVIETIEHAMLAERVVIERVFRPIGKRHGLRSEIHSDDAVTLLSVADYLIHSRRGKHNKKQPILRTVVVEDVGE